MQNKENKNNEIEYCVVCHKDTGYKKSDSIKERKNYIEGSGQLCKECFQEIYGGNKSGKND